MLEILFKHNSLITHSLEALAAVIGLFCLKKYKGTPAVFFIGILVYLFLIDTIGSYPQFYGKWDFLEPIRNSKLYRNTWWFTVFFDIVAVLLITAFYLKILQNKKHRILIKYVASAYLITSILVIYNNFNFFLSNAFPTLYIFNAVLIITCAICYFLEIIETDNIINFYKSFYFYVSVAIFIWWFIITPLVFYDRYFILSDRDFMVLKRSIYIFCNFFMYITFSIGLIVSKPEKNE